ncbi:MAG: hypothetical protein ACK4FJ_02350 [Ferrovibrio sp.]
MALMTILSRKGPPDIETAAASLHVAAEDIDQEYGILPIDPGQGLYCVRVRADSLPAAVSHGDAASDGDAYRGPFADLPIEPLTGKAGPRKR